MMNDFYKTTYASALAQSAGNPYSGSAQMETALSASGDFEITDEEAELKLPGYAIAFEEYHKRRSHGDTPEEALAATLTEWRALSRQMAYVPHRRQ